MRAALAAVLALLAVPAAAAAAPELVKVGDFTHPVHVAAPPGDAARVFVVEQGGLVKVVVNGQTAATPFLDVRDITEPGEERGLLSIAFPPDYATSGLFYVFLTATAAFAPSQETGDVVVLEGRRSAADPNQADPGHRRVVFSIPHPASNHNGGQLAFGPDGALYASVGDGADGANAQDGGSLLGKLLRLDPRTETTPHIWAAGLRNPWRFSFDRLTGDLLIGDVGEGSQEEIDFAPAGSGAGRNYGWPGCEGDPEAGSCPGAVAPALSLPHTENYHAVIGGYVVRDAGLPTLQGRYVFGDLTHTPLMSALVGAQGGSDLRAETALEVAELTSFGEDACGRLYVASSAGVHRLQDGAPSACSFPPGDPGTTPPPDSRPCTLTVRYRRTQRTLGGRGRLRLALSVNEPCTATVKARRFRTRTLALTPGVKRVVRLTPTRQGLRRMRRALGPGKRKVTVRVRIAARDQAGNLSVRTAQPRLRR
jgi:glucose/arabinose dehydrogenase